MKARKMARVDETSYKAKLKPTNNNTSSNANSTTNMSLPVTVFVSKVPSIISPK